MKLRLVFQSRRPRAVAKEVGRLCEARREADSGGGPGLPPSSGLRRCQWYRDRRGSRSKWQEIDSRPMSSLVRDGRLAGMGVQASPLTPAF